MKRILMVMAVAVLGLLGVAEMAFAQAADSWHSGAYDAAKGTNFADPDGYKRFIAHQGPGGEGTAAADGSAAASAGDSGNGNGTSGEGCSR